MSDRQIDPAFLALPFRALSEAALGRARELGASHADFRFERVRTQHIGVRDGRLQGASDSEDLGFAVRVIHQGAWGFASGVVLTTDEAVAGSVATEVSEHRGGQILTRNSSPDIGFELSVNPYRGCEHGCIYCYARPTHSYLDLSPGLDFETRLVAKMDAPELLRIGPYQGPLGCLEIPFARGVCGAAARERKSQLVPDVHAFPGHIACDEGARSEVVVPVFDDAGALAAVLDLDSHAPANFDDADRARLSPRGSQDRAQSSAR